MLPRYSDWPERLAALLAARRAEPFAWGGHDCCLLAADAVLAMTGADLAADYRGYTDRRGAAQALRRIANGGPRAAATLALGGPMNAPMLAGRGDIALLRIGSFGALGVVVGARIACATRPAGLSFVPITAARAAWRV